MNISEQARAAAVEAARGLAMDSAHIPLICGVIEPHIQLALDEQAKRIAELEKERDGWKASREDLAQKLVKEIDYRDEQAKRYEALTRAVENLSLGYWSCCQDGQHSPERSYCIPGIQLKNTLQDLKTSTKKEEEIYRETCTQCKLDLDPSLIESGWCIFCIAKDYKQKVQTSNNLIEKLCSALSNAPCTCGGLLDNGKPCLRCEALSLTHEQGYGMEQKNET